METMYIRRAGTEQRVLLPDEIRDINNRTIGINPDSLAPKLLKEAVMSQRVKENSSSAIEIHPNVVPSPIINNNRSEYKPYIEPTPSPKAEVKESAIFKKLPFIEANTKEVSVGHLKNDCIIPVFSKDNEITISMRQMRYSGERGLTILM